MRAMLRPLGVALLSALWVALLPAAVPLAGHDCHGLIGIAAHSPYYAFVGLTLAGCGAFLAAAAGRVRELR